MLSSTPRLLKGALIAIEAFNPVGRAVVFQYNPERVTRTLQPHGSADATSSRNEPQRMAGAPRETVSVELEFDATDGLADTLASESMFGIGHRLAALETMMYPRSAHVIATTTMAMLGTIEVAPPEGPFLLFVWGAHRVVPVKIIDLGIVEEAFNTRLAPIRATVTMRMQVLSYNDVPVAHPAYMSFLAHHIVQETLAVVGSVPAPAVLSSIGR